MVKIIDWSNFKKKKSAYIWQKFMNLGKTFVEPPWISGLFETEARWVS